MIGFHERPKSQFSLLPSRVFQIFFLLFGRVFFYHPSGPRMWVAFYFLDQFLAGDLLPGVKLAVHLLQIADLHVGIPLGCP